MKRTMLFAVMAMVTVAGFSQVKEAVKPEVRKASVKDSLPKNDTIYVDASKGTVIKLTSAAGIKILEVAPLVSPELITLNVPFGWIIGQYNYLDNSNGGFTKRQIEEQQQPLLPWYRQYMQAMQQAQQSPIKP